jgi:hypothetical protein
MMLILPGAVASAYTINTGSGTVNPLVVLDFQNIVAMVNGSAVTFADQVDDMTNIESGVGFKMRTGGVALGVTGAALTAFLAATTGTILFELDYTGVAHPPAGRTFQSATCNNNNDSEERWNIFSSDTDSWAAYSYDSGAGFANANGPANQFHEDGYNKVALSYDTTSIFICANGDPSDISNPSATPIASNATRVLIGYYNQTSQFLAEHQGNFLSLRLYPHQDATALQALSAP